MLVAVAACGRVEESSIAVGAPISTTSASTSTTAARTSSSTRPAGGASSAEPTTAPSIAADLPPAPSGYRWETSRAGDVSLLVPKTWSSIDLTKDDIEAMVKEVEKINPELGTQMRANKAALRQIELFVIGPAKDGFGPNVNVIEIPTGLPVESIVEGAKEQLAAFATIIDTSTRKVAGADAAVLRYSLEVNGATIVGQQIYVPAADFIAAVTISGDVPADVVDIMVNSITIFK
jgi:hypothetical protein